MVAVVWVAADCAIRLPVVVRSLAKHAHPLGAVRPVAPLIVITTVHTPVVPDTIVPAEAPATPIVALQPVMVKGVPVLTEAGLDTAPVDATLNKEVPPLR